MYSKTVDVAEIMRKIKAEALPKRVSEANNKTEHINKQFSIAHNEMDRSQSFISNTRNAAKPYYDMGMRIPSFTKFSRITRRLLVLFTRCIRKATLYMTREQTIVNRCTDDCIKALSENDNILLDTIMSLDQEVMRLKQNQIRLKALTQDKGIFNEMEYVEFENKHRGATEEISKRLYYYFNRHLLNKLDKNSNILDLGCGRGEWLALLKENGYTSTGIDLNDKMVLYCQMNDLKAVCGDCIEYLRSQPENSIDLITGFQLIEHLSMVQVSNLLEECARVLKKGAMVIFETPNAQNVEVGVYNFYSDPTHNRPLHKDLMEFLAMNKGFSHTEIAYWKKEEIDSWWNTVTSNDPTNVLDSDTMRTVCETIRKNFFIPPDYALVAVK